MRLIAAILVVACATAAGCRVAPRAADSKIPDRKINSALLNAPVVRLHIASMNDEEIPEEAFTASLETLKRHVRVPIEVIRHEPVQLAEPTDGTELAHEFPVHDGKRLMTRSDLPPVDPHAMRGPVVRVKTPRDGIVGITGMPTTSDPQSGEYWYTLRPVVEDNVVMVLIAPGNSAGSGHTGYTATVLREATDRLEPGLVVLRASAIRRRAGVFVPEERLWEWTLTHEIGHVLNVPANNEHACIIPNYGGIHCTRPECVMYTGVDWRVFASGLINGWPLDYCELCSAEIASAYPSSTPAAEQSQGAAGVTFGEMAGP